MQIHTYTYILRVFCTYYIYKEEKHFFPILSRYVKKEHDAQDRIILLDIENNWDFIFISLTY